MCEATSGHTDKASAIQRKLALCLRTISSTKRIRAAKISALSAVVYKEDMLHTTKASEGEAIAPRAKFLRVFLKPIKFLVPSILAI